MTTLTFRPPTDEDIPRLLALAAAGADELGIAHATQEADIRLSWTQPGVERERNFVVVESGGEIIARGAFRVNNGQASWDGVVAPSHRGRGVGTSLLRWGLERITEDPTAKEIFTGASTLRPDAMSLITAHGFEHVRSFFRMEHPDPSHAPPARFPDGIRLDTSRRGEELKRAIIEAYDNSFIDHWNFHPFDPVEFDHYMSHPDIDPELLLLAFEDERVVGLNLCFLERRATHTHGTVGVLGTVRGYRGRGLGAALLNHGVRALAAAGATLVELGVDSENPTGALGLYERNGFRRSHEWRTYRLVRP